MNRGRSKTLIQERNKKIAECYYQLEKELKNYSDVVSALSHMFFLSEYRIMAIIRQMVKEGTFVKGEPLKPMKRGKKRTESSVQINILLKLF